jgi:hypothetical protein
VVPVLFVVITRASYGKKKLAKLKAEADERNTPEMPDSER